MEKFKLQHSAYRLIVSMLRSSAPLRKKFNAICIEYEYGGYDPKELVADGTFSSQKDITDYYLHRIIYDEELLYAISGVLE